MIKSYGSFFVGVVAFLFAFLSLFIAIKSKRPAWPALFWLVAGFVFMVFAFFSADGNF